MRGKYFNAAQNGYKYDRPDIGSAIASASRSGYSGTSGTAYPTAPGFGGIIGTTTPGLPLSGTGYTAGRTSTTAFAPQTNASPTGNAIFAPVNPSGFSNSATYPGTGSGTGFESLSTGPGYKGENIGLSASSSRTGVADQQRISSGTLGSKNYGIRPGFSSDGTDGGDYSAIPGTPGEDYPIFPEIPNTSFNCNQQRYPGYYADVEAQCQVFHICALNRTYNFLCPNGTIFSQENLVCVWWNQFDCTAAPGLYDKNADLYDQSLQSFSQIGTTGVGSGLTSSGTTGGSYSTKSQNARPSNTQIRQPISGTTGPAAGVFGYPTAPGTGFAGSSPGTGFQPVGQIPVSYAPTSTSATISLGYPESGQPDGASLQLSQSFPQRYLPPRQG
ncbi:uncharacterized protein LOC128735820 [Sabethes cyaneus]|uniref:uncharacterized protein LOC128735820 n=1 Tax=Sabethes cyaneus TaxID=53552 RepID=UPI00237ECB8B|nr:uncharacterized protein LOC128735820 [Sabethes cyaneus]